MEKLNRRTRLKKWLAENDENIYVVYSSAVIVALGGVVVWANGYAKGASDNIARSGEIAKSDDGREFMLIGSNAGDKILLKNEEPTEET